MSIPRISPATASVAGYLAGHRGDTILVTGTKLATHTGLDLSTVRKALSRLRDLGAIEFEPRRPGLMAGSREERPWVITVNRSHWVWEALGLVPCEGGCGGTVTGCICDAFDNDGVMAAHDFAADPERF